jgi:hypothetical protein
VTDCQWLISRASDWMDQSKEGIVAILLDWIATTTTLRWRQRGVMFQSEVD